MAVFFDIQGVQSRLHGERGIARYILEQACALERGHQEVVARYLLNPDLTVPEVVQTAINPARLTFNDRFEASPGSAYHIGSPFELGVPIDRIWPPAARRSGSRLVIALYDLIPDIYSEIYLRNPEVKRQYKTRQELIRRADAILAISDATAADAVERLQVPERRVTVVGTGVSEMFRPPVSREAAFASLQGTLPWVEPGYILYTGGIDPRKNIGRLFEAYASLPARLRRGHQLILVCRVKPRDRAGLVRQLDDLRVADRVRLTGYVPDDQLVLLYQAAELFVFPSLYEGFGLPVAEAIACGTPVVAARSSSLVEIVTEDAALFDPTNPGDIRRALERALVDDELRTRLREQKLAERHTWPAVADRTAAVYDQLDRLPRRRRRSRLRIAFVSPLPPQESGVADYSFRLLTELTDHCDVDAFVDARVTVPADVTMLHLLRFDTADRARGGYDRIVYCMGNSRFHARALSLLKQRSGVVLAHDVRLVALYAWYAREWPQVEPRSFHEILRSMYPGRVPPWLGAYGRLGSEDAEEYGITMVREVIAASERFLVHSGHAAEMARLDCESTDMSKIGIVPFAFPEPDETGNGSFGERPLVATFGVSAPQKQSEKIIDAFAHLAKHLPDTEFAVVGRPVSSYVGDLYRSRAAELGIADRTSFTGFLDHDSFRAWLRRATIAIQLRSLSNGESSAAVADCLAAGIPTVVTDLGSARELPDSCVVKVPRDITVIALADEVARLLRNRGRMDALRREGIAHARENSFASAASALYRELLDG